MIIHPISTMDDEFMNDEIKATPRILTISIFINANIKNNAEFSLDSDNFARWWEKIHISLLRCPIDLKFALTHS